MPAYSSVLMCCHTGIPCRISRTRHPAPSQYTDMGYDTPPHHSIQTWDMTPRPVTVYGHGIRHPAPSQYTDMGYDTPPRHSIQTWDMTPRPVTVYRHKANLSLCYSWMWNVALEYTATHSNVLGKTRPRNPSPTFHTH